MNVDAHLPDGTTPAVDLFRAHEGPEAPANTASEHTRLSRLLVQGSPAWLNSSPVIRGSSRLSLTDGMAFITQTRTEVVVSAIKSGLTPKESEFNGEDPITILAFLTKLKTQLDNNRISEGAALSIIPDYLEDPARDDFLRHCDLGDDVPGGFDSYPGAIQYLLRTYAKDAYLEEALVELEDIKQRENDTEREYSRRLITTVYRLAGAITETDHITAFSADVAPIYALRFEQSGLKTPQDPTITS